VRQPDGVDETARRLPEARWRVALARGERDRLRHERVEGEALDQSVAEGAPRGDGVEGSRAVHDRPAQRDAAEVDRALALHQCPAPATSAVSSSWASSTGPSTQRRTYPCRVGTT